MILKSFEIENNIQKIDKFKLILIYGENIGLKETLKKKIEKFNKNTEIINLYQEDITKNKQIVINEVNNVSLFSAEKLIIINQTSESMLSEINNLLDLDEKQKVRIVLIAELLDKKSKLRATFEKKNNLAVIPCYNDNDITLRKLIQNELGEFKNLNSNSVNMILNYSNLNRKNILNNIEKIKSFYENKIISDDNLETLLNSDRNELFENIRDAALSGDKIKLNELLNNFPFTNEDAFLYINKLNYKLIKLLDILKENNKHGDLNTTLSKIRPPIFWKEKPVYLKLLKKWHISSVLDALTYLGKIEEKLKKNSTLNGVTVVKNAITNICTNSWTYF
jgi:DNA polymerase-3 subunit delta